MFNARIFILAFFSTVLFFCLSCGGGSTPFVLNPGPETGNPYPDLWQSDILTGKGKTWNRSVVRVSIHAPSDYFRERAVWAINHWNNEIFPLTNSSIRFAVSNVSNADVSIWFVPSTSGELEGRNRTGRTEGSIPEGMDVYINMDLAEVAGIPKQLQDTIDTIYNWTVVHELGHTIGFQHDRDGGLMTGMATISIGIDFEDKNGNGKLDDDETIIMVIMDVLPLELSNRAQAALRFFY